MADPSKKLAELVQKAGQLRLKPDHQRTEAERELFGIVRRGILVESALEGSFEEDDMVAMMNLMVSIGQERKQRQAPRARENLEFFLGSRRWLKVAQKRPELLALLKEFIIDTAVLGLLEAPPTVSDPKGKPAAVPILIDEELQKIAQPLFEGRNVMQELKFQFVQEDKASSGWANFNSGVTRLAQTAMGKEKMESSESGELKVLAELQGDWPKIISFLSEMYKLRKMRQRQIEVCVSKLKALSPSFAEAERKAEDAGLPLPWNESSVESLPAESTPSPEAAPPVPPPEVAPETPPAAPWLPPPVEEPTDPVPEASPGLSGGDPPEETTAASKEGAGLLSWMFGRKKPSETAKDTPPPAPPDVDVPTATIGLKTMVAPKAPPDGPARFGTVITDKKELSPFGKASASGYPTVGEFVGEPSAPLAPVAEEVKPGIAWIDVNSKAYETSKLNHQKGIEFRGFNCQEADGPWVPYVIQRVSSSANRVAVVILNRRHKKGAVAIRDHCAARGSAPPQFIVMSGKKVTPEEVCKEWGMRDIQVVTDWAVAADIALAEVRTPSTESVSGRPSAGPMEM
mmetsp:Transcript_673/g.1122  ORF Transcript_673/g.1122 Transcript_673/m.1122 type:complete len:572 (+) Transcript_673:30-1745(+)